MPESSNKPPGSGDPPRDQDDAFALVPRPPGALEKAGSRPKRILTTMVADTLVLARPTQPIKQARSVLLLKDRTFDELWELILKDKLGQKYDLKFTYFESASELQKLDRDQSFHLIALYFFNVKWDIAANDPFKLLSSLKHGKRIFVTQGMDLSEKCERAGVTFFELPSNSDEFYAVFDAALKVPVPI